MGLYAQDWSETWNAKHLSNIYIYIYTWILLIVEISTPKPKSINFAKFKRKRTPERLFPLQNVFFNSRTLTNGFERFFNAFLTHFERLLKFFSHTRTSEVSRTAKTTPVFFFSHQTLKSINFGFGVRISNIGKIQVYIDPFKDAMLVSHEPRIPLIPVSPNNSVRLFLEPFPPDPTQKAHERSWWPRPRHPKQLDEAAPLWPNPLQCLPLQTKGCPARAQTQARPESPGSHVTEPLATKKNIGYPHKFHGFWWCQIFTRHFPCKQTAIGLPFSDPEQLKGNRGPDGHGAHLGPYNGDVLWTGEGINVGKTQNKIRKHFTKFTINIGGMNHSQSGGLWLCFNYIPSLPSTTLLVCAWETLGSSN